MKVSQAKKIIGTIILWNLYNMGVKSKPTEYLDENISLNDLLKANRIVKSDNERRRKVQQQKHDKGLKTKGITISMTVDERMIAAVYTALSFKPNGEAACVINNIGVGCVIMKEGKK